MRRTVVAVAVVVTMVVGACTTDTGVDRAATGGSGSSSGPEVTVTSSTSTEASTTLPPTTVTTTTAPITTLPPTTVPPTTTTLPPQSITEPPGPLQGGSVGVRTMALQTALAEQFYDPGEADGRFGVKTTMSVWAFQALFGMPRDGIVTPELEQLILARPAPGDAGLAGRKPEAGHPCLLWERGALLREDQGGASMRERRHATGRLPVRTAGLWLARRTPGSALQPGVLQRWNSCPRGGVGTEPSGQPWLCEDPDARGRLLPGPG